MTDLKGTLANIARAIVDSPEDVVVTVTEETESSISLKLSVATGDMGKVIGKKGRIFIIAAALLIAVAIISVFLFQFGTMRAVLDAKKYYNNNKFRCTSDSIRRHRFYG